MSNGSQRRATSPICPAEAPEGRVGPAAWACRLVQISSAIHGATLYGAVEQVIFNFLSIWKEVVRHLSAASSSLVCDSHRRQNDCSPPDMLIAGSNSIFGWVDRERPRQEILVGIILADDPKLVEL